MLGIAGILPRAFLCVLGLSKIPSSFCLGLLFVWLHIMVEAIAETKGPLQNVLFKYQQLLEVDSFK